MRERVNSFLRIFQILKNSFPTEFNRWMIKNGYLIKVSTTLNQIERVGSNEELGRYQFIANNSLGDELTCDIYLPNEWNIPQLNMLGCISARYRNVDVE